MAAHGQLQCQFFVLPLLLFFVFFVLPWLFLQSAPLAPILDYDCLDDPTGVT